MLGYMRKHSQSFLIYLVFAVLIVVFAFTFGPGGQGCGVASEQAAVVNGETIGMQEFQRSYTSEFYRWQSRNPEFFNAEQAKKMNLRGRVLDSLVNRRLLAQEAKRRGLMITDAELRTSITENPQFQVDGAFDLAAYQSIVNQRYGMPVARFEMMQRREMLANKMIDLVLADVLISDAELETEFRVQRDRAQVNFVRFDPQRFAAGQDITDEQVKDVLEKQGDQVRAFFEREFYRYREQRQVHARRILVPLTPDADEAAQVAAQEQVATIQAELAKGAPFAELATKYSKGPEASTGGDMGWLDPVKHRALLRATGTLEAGSTAPNAVRTPEGLNLVQVEEVKAPRQKAFEEIQSQVAKDMLLDQQGAMAAVAAASSWIAKFKSGSPVEQLTTPEPTTDAPVPTGLAPLDRPYLETTDWITRDMRAIPKIGVSPQLMDDVFGLSAAAPLLERPYRVGRHFYVVWLAERQAPDMELFELSAESIRASALARKSNYVLTTWLKVVRDAAEVTVHPGIAGASAQPDA